MKPATALLLSLLPTVLAVNGAALEKNELTLVKSMHGHSDKILRVLKRQLDCPSDEYHTNVHCCKLCPAGTFKSKDCSQEHGLPNCIPCQEGLYTNIANKDEECHLCTACDHGEAFEVDQHCTPERNTICRCMEHYFCNETSSCKHCEPCDKCENGYVKEECTRRKNTVCQGRDPLPAYAIALIVCGTLLVAGAVAAAVYCRRRKKCSVALGRPTSQETRHLQEDITRHLPEKVDLEQHFTDIASITTIKDMLLFVRKNDILQPKIEEILEDNRQNVSEQKIQLLSHWYESHGKNGACRTLIETFEKNGRRVLAKNILEIINLSDSSRMVSNSVDPDEEHNI